MKIFLLFYTFEEFLLNKLFNYLDILRFWFSSWKNFKGIFLEDYDWIQNQTTAAGSTGS